jgi:hypothetical protein
MAEVEPDRFSEVFDSLRQSTLFQTSLIARSVRISSESNVKLTSIDTTLKTMLRIQKAAARQADLDLGRNDGNGGGTPSPEEDEEKEKGSLFSLPTLSSFLKGGAIIGLAALFQDEITEFASGVLGEIFGSEELADSLMAGLVPAIVGGFFFGKKFTIGSLLGGAVFDAILGWIDSLGDGDGLIEIGNFAIPIDKASEVGALLGGVIAMAMGPAAITKILGSAIGLVFNNRLTRGFKNALLLGGQAGGTIISGAVSLASTIGGKLADYLKNVKLPDVSTWRRSSAGAGRAGRAGRAVRGVMTVAKMFGPTGLLIGSVATIGILGGIALKNYLDKRKENLLKELQEEIDRKKEALAKAKEEHEQNPSKETALEVIDNATDIKNAYKKMGQQRALSEIEKAEQYAALVEGAAEEHYQDKGQRFNTVELAQVNAEREFENTFKANTDALVEYAKSALDLSREDVEKLDSEDLKFAIEQTLDEHPSIKDAQAHTAAVEQLLTFLQDDAQRYGMTTGDDSWLDQYNNLISKGLLEREDFSRWWKTKDREDRDFKDYLDRIEKERNDVASNILPPVVIQGGSTTDARNMSTTTIVNNTMVDNPSNSLSANAPR